VAESSDLSGVATDMAWTDLAGAIIGPGPLGALPSGYCCQKDSDCRGRHCVSAGGPTFCADSCTGDSICTEYGFAMTCNLQSASDVLCGPTSPSTFKCGDPQQFIPGTKPIGSCCSAGTRSGQECAGGNCVTVGSGNPFICTQGCLNSNECPGGYECLLDTRSCVPAPFLEGNPDYTYTCQ
jgi:hypothetical protein